MQRSRLSRARLLILTAALGVMSCSPEYFQSYAYRNVDLDTRELTIKPDGPLATECPREASECYVRRIDFRGRPHVDHLGPYIHGAGAVSRRSYLNMFFVERDQRLVYRTKVQLVLAGPYGHVYARSEYYYAAQYQNDPNRFEVASYSTEAPYEAPETISSIPAGSSLSAVSLVRILRHPPGFLVLSADYAPTGGLRAFHVNGTIDGKWTNLPADSKRAGLELGITTYGDRSPHRETFGFPDRFPAADYVAAPRKVWRSTSHAEDLTAVTLHYDFNRYAVQHVFRGEALDGTRTLQFMVTREDEALRPLDEKRDFGSPAGAVR